MEPAAPRHRPAAVGRCHQALSHRQSPFDGLCRTSSLKMSLPIYSLRQKPIQISFPPWLGYANYMNENKPVAETYYQHIFRLDSNNVSALSYLVTLNRDDAYMMAMYYADRLIIIIFFKLLARTGLPVSGYAGNFVL